MSAIDTAYNAVVLWTTTHPREFELLRDGSVAAALFALLIMFSLKACGPKAVNPLEEAIGTVNAEVVLLKEVLTERKDDVEKLRGEMTNLLSKVLNVLHLRNEDIKKLREDLTELDKNAANNTKLVVDEVDELTDAQHTADEAIKKLREDLTQLNDDIPSGDDIQKAFDEVTDAQHTADEAIQKEFDALTATMKSHVSKDAVKEMLAPLRENNEALQAQLKKATDDIQHVLAWLWIGCAERAPSTWRADTFYRDHPDITAPLLNSLSGAILLGPDKLSIQTALTYIPHGSRKHWASTNMRAVIEHSFPGSKAVM
jgi:uncharacterized phage infection (PIP) family protein YhgE